jgi:hypothetical protein
MEGPVSVVSESHWSNRTHTRASVVEVVRTPAGILVMAMVGVRIPDRILTDAVPLHVVQRAGDSLQVSQTRRGHRLALLQLNEFEFW